MPRSREAYLVDIIDACEAIETVLPDVDVEAYLSSRMIRSAIDDETVFRIAQHDTPILLDEVRASLKAVENLATR